MHVFVTKAKLGKQTKRLVLRRQFRSGVMRELRARARKHFEFKDSVY